MKRNAWTKPEILNIGIEQTQGGGSEPTDHDGVIYQVDGKTVEEYWS